MGKEYEGDRIMDRPTRAANLAEIWKQLSWLEGMIKLPYMAGDTLTHADMTWFPTTILMEYMLPRNFGWPEMFHETDHFPRLAKWLASAMKQEAFKAVREDLLRFWEAKDKDGHFDAIRDEVADRTFKWKYP